MLALPATLRAGGHVRVTLLTGLLGEGVAGRGLRLVVLAAALALCSFAAWHSGVQAFDSWQFASVSFGMVRVPLWLPQGVMTAGLALFALALADELVVALSGRLPAHARAEGARSRGEG
jgi:TRAP-type C4-dicarboxylate transport system permease small subunit